MSKPFKPGGYNSASPYFMVKDAQQLAHMLQEVFGATEQRRYERPDGSIMHMEVLLDDSVIMMSDATPQYPPYTLWMHVYVPDAVAVYERAIEYGCEGVEAPVQKDGDPDRRGTFKDAAGNYWAVSTQLEA